MKKLDRARIEKLAKDLKLALSDEELKQFEEESHHYLNHVAMLQEIDTEGVEMMSYPFEAETTWLREDVVDHVIDQADAFKNAPRVEDDYFEIVKVVEKA